MAKTADMRDGRGKVPRYLSDDALRRMIGPANQAELKEARDRINAMKKKLGEDLVLSVNNDGTLRVSLVVERFT
jgi:hypothetical protein